ncbi:type II toxin-antitoxin system VapC family toxin [Georgenia yuyongxinii]
MAYYLDTSALVKLVVAEAESVALREWLSGSDRQAASSDLARTELARAVRRAAPHLAGQARAVLDSLVLLDLTAEMCEQAGRLGPPSLRSLDAMHLAAALRLGDELDGLITYDDRLAEATAALGIPVLAPGAPAHR